LKVLSKIFLASFITKVAYSCSLTFLSNSWAYFFLSAINLAISALAALASASLAAF